MTPLPVFFGDEWQRFQEGIAGLDPDYAGRLVGVTGAGGARPGEPNTITIPGWTDVIRVGPRPVIPDGGYAEYREARRAGRPVQLPGAVVSEIERRMARRDAMRTSTQPGWSRAVGQVMTAIDNVQDFVSTLATIGRLFLWGMGAVAPVAGGPALRLGARVGLRFVPIVGWVVLAGDVLNMFNLLGMVAMPVYALLCDGPRNALLAGVPAVVLKNVLCRQVWTSARLNPFSRAGRAARRLRSLGRLPGVGNLIEVAQTTETLFGIGLSIGGLYGMVMEGLFAVGAREPGATTRVNTEVLTGSLGLGYQQRIQQMSPAERYVTRQAARVLATAPPLMAVHADLDDETHLLVYTAVLAALPIAIDFLHRGPYEEVLEAVSAGMVTADPVLHATTAQDLADVPEVLRGAGRWPVPGAPRTMTAAAYVEYHGAAIARAVGALFTPRRDTWDGAFFGAVCNEGCDYAWHLITGDPEFFKWELSADFKLFTAMAVDGLLVAPRAPEENVWRFWVELRAQVQERGGRIPEAADVLRAAERHDVPLVRLLAPESPLPEEWRAWLESGGGATS
jgi:hypothetical protein